MSFFSYKDFVIDVLNNLGDESIAIYPLDSALPLVGKVGSNSYHYGNNDVDLLLTHNPVNDTVHGHATFYTTGYYN